MNKLYNPFLVLISLFFFGFSVVACMAERDNSEISASNTIEAQYAQLVEEPEIIKEPIYDIFGFDVDSFKVEQRNVQRNESLSLMLQRQGFGHSQIHNISQASQGVFNLRRIVAGRPIHFYTSKDSPDQPRYLVYERDPINYVVFDLKAPAVTLGEKDVERQSRVVEGVINSSLYEAFLQQETDPRLAYLLADVFAWQIDFYRIQKGDSFRVLFEERLVDGEKVGLGRIKAAEFNHRGREFSALRFEQDGRIDYFDKDGNSLRKAFLRAPLEYSRISSRFSNNRRHPILNTNRPHHGTDYAAPTGTPIRAVGDGQIIHAGYDRNNGNYIRIRHNSTYETGYLHMSRLANGMRNGTRVTQGQIIGYVGSTGLATGPHLCFRFWQNGRPVDPYRIEYPSSTPIQQKYADAFRVHKTGLIALLNTEPEIEPEYIEEEEPGNRWQLASVNLQPLVLAL